MNKDQCVNNYIEHEISLLWKWGNDYVTHNGSIQISSEKVVFLKERYNITVQGTFNRIIDKMIGEADNQNTLDPAKYGYANYDHPWKRQDHIIRKIILDKG